MTFSGKVFLQAFSSNRSEFYLSHRFPFSLAMMKVECFHFFYLTGIISEMQSPQHPPHNIQCHILKKPKNKHPKDFVPDNPKNTWWQHTQGRSKVRLSMLYSAFCSVGEFVVRGMTFLILQCQTSPGWTCPIKLF